MRLTALVLSVTLLLTCATAQTFKVFFTFNFTDGSAPNGDLIRDSAGNLYGTTQFGGSSNRGLVFNTSLGGDPTWGCGTVFKLGKNGSLKSAA
jgi:uncharacterized repeat protein (TIGR03803 family)